jgi:hypothetical protein
LIVVGRPFSRPSPRKREPLVFLPPKGALIDSFETARNGRVFWGFLTGDKDAISPKLKNQFNLMELGFLFSPSGLHLSGFLLLLFFLSKKVMPKKVFSTFKTAVTFICYFLPSLSIKRIVILRLLIFFKARFKMNWRIESLFFVTFLLSYFLGHYSLSPAGFVMSFLFMGTFISLRDQSRLMILLGLFSAHLLLSAFNGESVSLPALIVDIPLLSFFTLIMALSGPYLLSFRLVSFNWMEYLIQSFLWLVKKSSKLVIGTHMHASLFLLLGLGIYFYKRDKRFLVASFVLHAGLANSPSFFVSGSSPQAPALSGDKQPYYSERRASE